MKKLHNCLRSSLIEITILVTSFMKRVGGNFIFIITLTVAFGILAYRKFNADSFYLICMTVLVLGLTGIRHRGKSKEGVANALFDSVIWLCLALFGFYGGFYLSLKKLNSDKRQHAISVINSTFNRVTNRLIYLEDIHSDTPVDAQGLREFMISKAQVPYYLLDQLPNDDILIYLSDPTFEFLCKSETFERKLQKDILDKTRSDRFRTEALQAAIILLNLIRNQLLDEREVMNRSMDSLTFREATYGRDEMLISTKQDVENSSILRIKFEQLRN